MKTQKKAERRSRKVTEKEERDKLTCSRTGLSLIFLTRDLPPPERREGGISPQEDAIVNVMNNWGEKRGGERRQRLS